MLGIRMRMDERALIGRAAAVTHELPSEWARRQLIWCALRIVPEDEEPPEPKRPRNKRKETR